MADITAFLRFESIGTQELLLVVFIALLFLVPIGAIVLLVVLLRRR